MKHTLKVLVTGASRGIGRSICERLDTEGYELVGIARSRPADWPKHITFHEADLSDHEAVKETLVRLVQTGPFYGLVNNVGFVPTGTLESVDALDLQRSVALNIEVSILCAQAVLPGMRSLGQGRIVNISSRAALGKHGRTLYSMAKAGLIGMTRTWALELAADGITVNAIAPGPIATDFFQSANNENANSTRKLLAGIPVGRVGQPQDVAHAAAYFIDPRCSFVTGQTHYVCGGITIGAA